MFFNSRLVQNFWYKKYEFILARQERKRRRKLFIYKAFSALSFNGIDGDYAEFGCWGGMTFALAYQESRRHGNAARLWAFDSFQGLPPSQEVLDEHPLWKAGAMATSLDEFHRICASNKVPRDSYTVVPGFYDQTLPKLAPADPPRTIALAYIDCDLYSSTKTVLEFLRPRMKHGMIIAFDDYFCWSSTQISGERKAMLEFLAHESRWSFLPYLQFGWHGNSFVVEDKKLIS